MFYQCVDVAVKNLCRKHFSFIFKLQTYSSIQKYYKPSYTKTQKLFKKTEKQSSQNQIQHLHHQINCFLFFLLKSVLTFSLQTLFITQSKNLYSAFSLTNNLQQVNKYTDKTTYKKQNKRAVSWPSG